MNKSPLLETQQSLCPDLVLASVIDGTWEMPAEYAPHHAQAEYDAVHSAGGAGVIDRSWRAILRLTGPDRSAFLQGMVTNDILALAPSQGCHAAFLDTTGHILADLWVWNVPGALFIETDPQVSGRLLETLDRYLIMEDVQIADVSRDWVILAVRGSGTNAVVSSFLSPPIGLDPATIHDTVFGNETTGFAVVPADTDVPGLDLWLPAEAASSVWETLLAAGVVPIGELAAETLRIEAGTPVWGRELSEAILLPEAELPETISYTKGCYVGQEIIARLRARGHANRLLRGIRLAENAPVPHDSATIHAPEHGPEAGREIGRITSASASPRLRGCALALGYVRREYAENNTAVSVHLPQPDGTVFAYPAAVLTRPFASPE